VIFLFRWKHNDGSIVEFSEKGWKADDPQKSAWLIEMSELCGNASVLTPAIRIWLRKNCHLVEFTGPEGKLRPIRVPCEPGSELATLQVLARAVNAGISPNFSERTEILRRAARKGRITASRINLACDQFFRSRGMPLKQNFNKWQISKQAGKEDQTYKQSKGS
jgi:hypothetical protein